MYHVRATNDKRMLQIFFITLCTSVIEITSARSEDVRLGLPDGVVAHGGDLGREGGRSVKQLPNEIGLLNKKLLKQMFKR